jgi:hypothetical protein
LASVEELGDDEVGELSVDTAKKSEKECEISRAQNEKGHTE